MTRYDDDLDCPVAFAEQVVEETLAEVLAGAGMRQLHVAETEKYAHVTYFLNGGREEPWPGENRVLVPSPREVGTYDEKPEMSAPEVTRRFVEGVETGEYGFAIVNFANPDMVGHSGVIPAVIEAVETTDRCLGRRRRGRRRAGRRLSGYGRSRQRGALAGSGWRQPAHRPHVESRAAARHRRGSIAA